MDRLGSSRWRASLSHAMLAVPMFALAAFLLRGAPWSAPALVVIAWFWSREKFQREAAALEEHEPDAGASEEPLVRHVAAWSVGWWPGEWTAQSRLDFYLPAIAALILAALVELGRAYHW